MSRADWSFLEHLLEEGQEYSTGIGRVWLTVLFLFRILVLGTAAESAWDDEQAGFVCNTLQPGCTAVCYDRAFPISHFRYFVLQIIFVSTPSIFFFGYVALRAGTEQRKKEEKEEEAAKERQAGEGSGERNVAERDDTNGTKDIAENKEKQERKRGDRKLDRALPEPPKLKGRLLCAYAFSILLKILLEVGFIVGLWLLYDGFLIAAKYECEMLPCPHTVDCFVSRPTEKSIFTVYTQVIATISLLLNVVELFHLLQLAVSHRLEKRYGAQGQYYLPPLEKATLEDAPELQREAPQPYNEGSHVNLPGLEGEGEATRHPNPCESYGDVAIEVNWGTAEAGADLLPSYVNCMGAMRKTHSPRVHYKKPTTHHTEKKNTKTAHKGHLKRKHYV